MSVPYALPAKRLAGFYFFYYATVGAFLPYWGPYLEARGFTPLQMGVAFGLMGVTRSVMPVLWGLWGDRARSRMQLIRWAAVASLLLFLLIPFSSGIYWVGGLMVAYVLFWHALLPQFEVVAIDHVNAVRADYSRIRLWGSVGFVVAVLGLGVALDRLSILHLPWLVGAFWVGMVWLAFRVPDAPHVDLGATAPGESLWRVLRRPEVLVLLGVCLCSQLSFAPYYNFFTLFLERHGYTRSMAGLLWALGVIVEIGLFVVMGRLIVHYGARNLMIVALAATTLRWLLTALLVDSLAVLLLVQCAHALTFGAYHAVAMYYVQRLFPRALQGSGQAVYAAVAYGIGGSVGSLSSGFLWDAVSPEAAFLAMAAVAGAGTWLAWRRLPALRD
jgi:MFS transporter, PPP family, 3-phenylpropionic acid transporter